MTLEDIGDGDDDALLCRTNLNACYQCRNGKWFFPSGSSVPSAGSSNTTFYRTRGQMVVRLNHKGGGEDGIYRCEIPNSVNVTKNIYIGVYMTNTSIGE